MRSKIIFLIIIIIIHPPILLADDANPFNCSPILELFSEIDNIIKDKQIFGTGPKVLEEAKQLNKHSMSLLGRYFRSGERGFPKNDKIAFCLAYWSYECGNALSAWDIAEKYSEMKEYKKAVKYYGIMFGYSYAQEAFHIKEGFSDPLEPEIRMSHYSFAEVDHLIKSKKIPEDVARQLFAIGAIKGASLYKPLLFPTK